MSLEAVRAFLAADDARERARASMSTATDEATLAAQAAARELEEDGGLVAYAQRIARRRDPSKAAPMHHLARIAERCEAAEHAMRGERTPVFAVMHAAVQHGKTSLLQAFVLRTLRRNPRAKIGYVSFNSARAEGKMWTCRELAHGEGVHIHPSFNTKKEWRTVEGGLVVAGGIGDGSWTGEGFDVIVCDDLYSGPEESESAAHRAKVERSFFDVIWTRRAKHTSILVNMARWNPNDLSGVLIRMGWQYVCLPAIGDDGQALWPEVMPLAELLAIRDGRPARGEEPPMGAVPRRTWNSLYQGRPVPDGEHVFEPSHLKQYDELPDGPFFEALGIDVAYGAKARNDRSAIVGWRMYVAQPRELYLVEPWLGHEQLELFACRVAQVQIHRAGGPLLGLPGDARELGAWQEQVKPYQRAQRTLAWWYASGTEAGGAGVLDVYGAVVHTVKVGIDKLARAQGGYIDPRIGGYTSAWNEGRIWWPRREGEHAQAIRIQHEDFTGATSDDDDGVDAAVGGHDAMQVRDLLRLQEQKAKAAQASMLRGMQGRAPHHPLGVAPRAPRI